MRRGAFLQPTRIAGLVLVTLLLLGAGAAVSPSGVKAAPTTHDCIAGIAAYVCDLTVTVEPSGAGFVSGHDGKISNCTSKCTTTYNTPFNGPYENVTLTATPAQGWRVKDWDRSPCSNEPGPGDANCTVVMAHDVNATAVFERVSYRLTVNLAGTGSGTVTGGGISCPSTCFVDVAPGTTIVLTERPSSGSTWGGWSEPNCGTATTCQIVVNGDRTVTATFNSPTAVKRTLKVSVTGTGKVTGPGIDCPSDCEEQYDNNTGVQLTAAPGSGLTTTWGGDCSGTTTTCSLTMSSDKNVSVTFASGPGPQNRTLTVTVNGSGSVTGAGISCPGDCTQDYALGTQVTLTASAATDFERDDWSGDCVSAGSSAVCTLAMTASRSAVANFSPIAKPQEVKPLIDGGKKTDPLPDVRPPEVEQVIVQVDGTGQVTSSLGARVLAGAAATKPINCGISPSGALKYDCYGEYGPGQALTLKAKPAEGYVFKRWTGACAASSEPTCRLTTRDSRTTTAIFQQGGVGAAVAALLRPPNLRVRWQSSVGAGNLVLRGSTSMAANARIDMRRPGGGPLATRKLKLTGGSFRETMALKNGRLRGGAKLFPGGFTVALTGRAGRLKLPLQIKTISIPAPAEGVVRTAFKSRTQNGKVVTRFPAKTKIAWANFRFETQPRLGQKLSVRWYFPNGRPVGEIQKSNRPVVSSYLALEAGLDSGLWVAELRAGKRVIQRLSVRIG